ncbi:MAG: hypothetical protein HC900_10080 [Methylacidiphilales bacterium]|nr:hypothetical protein [Candidatus Methylacidiphilales bacterium]
MNKGAAGSFAGSGPRPLPPGRGAMPPRRRPSHIVPDHHGDLHFGQTDRPLLGLAGLRRAALVRVLAALALFAALALPAAAASLQNASLQDALARFAANDFAETAKAIDEIAESGAPQAVGLMDALLNRRLMMTPDGGVFFTDAQGRAFDALTGNPVAAVPKGAQLVRTNNKLRGQIENSLGTLRLQVADPAKRREAAEIVLRARDVTALPAVRAALSREHDPVIAKVLRETEAALVLASPTPPPIRSSSPSPSCAPAPTRTPSRRCAPPPPVRRSPSPRRRAAPSSPSRSGSRSRPRCRMCGTACRSARCCCWRRSASPSPSG